MTDWKLVHLGLSIMFSSLLCAAVLLLCFFVALAYFAVTNETASMVFRGLTIVFLGGMLVSFAVAGVGQFLCCTAPPESGAKGNAIASAISLLLLLLLGTIPLILWLTEFSEVLFRVVGRPGTAALFIMGGIFLIGAFLAWHLLFVVFLRNVARRFRNVSLAGNAESYLGLYVAVISICTPLILVSGVLGLLSWSPWSGVACWTLAVPVLGIVSAVWYLVLLQAVRDCVAQAMRGP